jgi:hypothetical protein
LGVEKYTDVLSAFQGRHISTPSIRQHENSGILTIAETVGGGRDGAECMVHDLVYTAEAKAERRLWREQDKRDAARDLLAPIYG